MSEADRRRALRDGIAEAARMLREAGDVIAMTPQGTGSEAVDAALEAIRRSAVADAADWLEGAVDEIDAGGRP